MPKLPKFGSLGIEGEDFSEIIQVKSGIIWKTIKLMKQTGDKEIDIVLKNIAPVARDIIRAGNGADVETCLEKAIALSMKEFLWGEKKFREQSLRRKIALNEYNIRERCWQIILDIQKRNRLIDIRKTSVEVTIKDFIESTGLPMEYTLRNNSSVRFFIQVPATGQYLRFYASFSKILSDGWSASTERDLRELFAISARLGRLRLSSANE